MVIELSDGQKLPMRYGGHPPRNSVDYFWAVGWVIPENYPTGSLYYKVVATDLQGRTQTWQSFQDPRSQIEVVAGTVQYSGDGAGAAIGVPRPACGDEGMCYAGRHACRLLNGLAVNGDVEPFPLLILGGAQRRHGGDRLEQHHGHPARTTPW